MGGCLRLPVVNHLGAGADPLGASLMRDGVFDVSKYPVAKKTTAKTATRAKINGTKLPFMATSNFLRRSHWRVRHLSGYASTMASQAGSLTCLGSPP